MNLTIWQNVKLFYDKVIFVFLAHFVPMTTNLFCLSVVSSKHYSNNSDGVTVIVIVVVVVVVTIVILTSDILFMSG